MTKLTFIQKVLFLFGYRYLANRNTKEIHNLRYLHHNCHTKLISRKSRMYLTTKEKDELITSTEYNGCRWCMKKVDKG